MPPASTHKPAAHGSRRAAREAGVALTTSTSRSSCRRRSKAARNQTKRAGGVVRHTTQVLSVAALAAVTVVLPFLGGLPSQTSSAVSALVAPDAASLPSITTVLTAPAPSLDRILVPSDKAAAASHLFAAATRPQHGATALPGCDGVAHGPWVNGKLTPDQLCTLDWGPHEPLRPDAAVALKEMNNAFVARFGFDMCITDGYRPLEDQFESRSLYGHMAAAPGTSNHGYGLAVDFCLPMLAKPDVWAWFQDNAATFGWHNPPWAIPGNPKFEKTEQWHWEFAAEVAKIDAERYPANTSR